MQLYEANGFSLLIRDQKDKLGELIEVGKEVVAYNCTEGAAELIRYYTPHLEEAIAIVRVGQARTMWGHPTSPALKS